MYNSMYILIELFNMQDVLSFAFYPNAHFCFVALGNFTAQKYRILCNFGFISVPLGKSVIKPLNLLYCFIFGLNFKFGYLLSNIQGV